MILNNRFYNIFLKDKNFGICLNISNKYFIFGFFKKFQNIINIELPNNDSLFYKIRFKFFFGNFLEIGQYVDKKDFKYSLLKNNSNENIIKNSNLRDNLVIRNGAKNSFIFSLVKKPTKENPVKDFINLTYTTLEIAITDFCNLTCNFCSQGTPLQKDKLRMTYDQIKNYIKLAIKNNEIDIIKLSGGEPTMHPDFRKICKIIKKNQSKKIFQLASNGIKMKKYLHDLIVFDQIDLTHYPNENDEIFFNLKKLKLKNVITYEKDNFVLDNVFDDNKNANKNFDVYKFCNYSKVKKIVQGRLYNCCIAFGQSIRKNINRENISLKIENSLNLNNNLDYKEVCSGCYVDVRNEKK